MAFEAIDINNDSGFQEIKIPENLKIDDNKVYLKKIGNALYIIPYHNPWQNMIDSFS
jgi:antitoxin VapB